MHCMNKGFQRPSKRTRKTWIKDAYRNKIERTQITASMENVTSSTITKVQDMLSSFFSNLHFPAGWFSFFCAGSEKRKRGGKGKEERWQTACRHLAVLWEELKHCTGSETRNHGPSCKQRAQSRQCRHWEKHLDLASTTDSDFQYFLELINHIQIFKYHLRVFLGLRQSPARAAADTARDGWLD